MAGTWVKVHNAMSKDDYESWEERDVSRTLNTFENDSDGRATVLVGGGLVVRRLTPVECERLMGVPDDWTRWRVGEDGVRVEQSDSARYKQCGNGLAVPVAEWIIARVVGAA